MSFRTRLTSFFVVIVLLPMVAIGALTFELIANSSSGRASARANGLAAAAANAYRADEIAARVDAGAVAEAVANLPAGEIRARLATAETEAGLERTVVKRNGRLVADVGDRSAIAPGIATARGKNGTTMVMASATTAAQFAAALSGPNDAIVVRQGGQTLASTAAGRVPAGLLPGTLTVGKIHYATATNPPRTGFGIELVTISALSNTTATTPSLVATRILAVAFLAAFVLFTFGFAVLSSRGLERTIERFLRAARQLGSGDFSEPVPVEGRDEFAQLATEFNRMSDQLAERLAQLRGERQRLRDSIKRAGKTMEANLDADALPAVTLGTAVAGVEASFGRLSIRRADDEPLREAVREGPIDEFSASVLTAEQSALAGRTLGQAPAAGGTVLSVPLGPFFASGRPAGLITVGRRERPFSDDEQELLSSLAGQAALALDNVRLHEEATRRAQTDLLTGLVNHGQFQAILSYELEQVRRYHYPVGLIMIDIDNFKSINDTHGHPQGDQVLRAVAQVLRETSREGDTVARYGGEEMAAILPHTDIDGAETIAERIRLAIANLAVPLLDGSGYLHVTTSVGVAETTDASKESLIAEADSALYRAKRGGKNRTVRATSVPAGAGAYE